MDLVIDAILLGVVSEVRDTLLLRGHDRIILWPWEVRNGVVIMWELDV